MSGEDFIQTAGDSGPDLYVTESHRDYGTRPAGVANLDFIASARQDLPSPIAEVRRLRTERARHRR